MINWQAIFNQYSGGEARKRIRISGKQHNGSRKKDSVEQAEVQAGQNRKQNQHEKITL